MIKQNIKVALFVVLGLVAFWLIMFIFIKLDVSCQAVITFNESYSFISIDAQDGAYIENHNIDYVKIEYKKQYFSCSITYSSADEQYSTYLISLPDIGIDKTNPFPTNIIIDSLNVYQYWLKKIKPKALFNMAHHTGVEPTTFRSEV